MRVVVQRVTRASCTVDGSLISDIQNGYLVLVGFTFGDDEDDINYLAKKISGLRIFEDEVGKMNLNIKAVNGSILAISQFTLYANCSEGNRPSFTEALTPNLANDLYEKFVDILNKKYEIVTKKGVFGAHMVLDFINDGPVTIIIDSKKK